MTTSILPVSAAPTTAELRALAALVPTWFRIEAEDGAVLVTLHAPGAAPPRALVTYAIRPGPGGDFAGTPLAELVTALGETVMSHYRAAADDASQPSLVRVLQVANDPPLLATRRAAPGGELVATTARVHTVAVDDWFADG